MNRAREAAAGRSLVPDLTLPLQCTIVPDRRERSVDERLRSVLGSAYWETDRSVYSVLRIVDTVSMLAYCVLRKYIAYCVTVSVFCIVEDP